MTNRVEFRLSMPRRPSWNGRWSGEDKNYTVIRELSDEQITKLLTPSVVTWPRELIARLTDEEKVAVDLLLEAGDSSDTDERLAALVPDERARDCLRAYADSLGTVRLKKSGLAKYRRAWTHRWSDGWLAEIVARVLPSDEIPRKSDGFNGYEWMIDNILAKGTPYGEVTS